MNYKSKIIGMLFAMFSVLAILPAVVTAAGNDTYAAGSKTVTVKVKVK